MKLKLHPIVNIQGMNFILKSEKSMYLSRMSVVNWIIRDSNFNMNINISAHTLTLNKRKERQDTLIYTNHHHHHVALVARISLTLSRHSSLSFIALGRSSGQHPVSSHSCWMYVRAGRPAFARPCVGVHKSTSLMSSSLLLQQCPACLDIYYHI